VPIPKPSPPTLHHPPASNHQTLEYVHTVGLPICAKWWTCEEVDGDLLVGEGTSCNVCFAEKISLFKRGLLSISDCFVGGEGGHTYFVYILYPDLEILCTLEFWRNQQWRHNLLLLVQYLVPLLSFTFLYKRTCELQSIEDQLCELWSSLVKKSWWSAISVCTLVLNKDLRPAPTGSNHISCT